LWNKTSTTPDSSKHWKYKTSSVLGFYFLISACCPFQKKGTASKWWFSYTNYGMTEVKAANDQTKLRENWQLTINESPLSTFKLSSNTNKNWSSRSDVKTRQAVQYIDTPTMSPQQSSVMHFYFSTWCNIEAPNLFH